MPTPRLTPQLRRSVRNVQTTTVVKVEAKRAPSPRTAESPASCKKPKREPASSAPSRGEKRVKAGDEMAKAAQALRDRKLKSFSAFCRTSPFPDFLRPTAQECRVAREILARLHGERHRPEAVVAPTTSAGCGDSASVLDALVRTILSQNTSSRNSTRAKRGMDEEYGGCDRWEAIADGGQARLQKSIQSGGLAAVKSRVIISILRQTKAKYGVYSLDHLFRASDEDAMRELISFQGVGPKTASCVLLFCLRRPSFAVDTHVYRITGLLGWRPSTAGREETQAHLDAVVADGEKYALHVLLVTHGRQCEQCRAGGKSVGGCALRRAFPGGRFAGAGEEDVVEEDGFVKKEEEEEEEKTEGP
ncbi:hypothetical protein E4U41_003560 [Claviceps citrina]|nr:hypothetical protein E4U41_003560 [Claviceps citrina]